jgi:hypothetical protein
MALAVGLDASFDNTYDWKGIWKNVGETDGTKAYITNYETFRWIINGSYICNTLFNILFPKIREKIVVTAKYVSSMQGCYPGREQCSDLIRLNNPLTFVSYFSREHSLRYKDQTFYAVQGNISCLSGDSGAWIYL